MKVNTAELNRQADQLRAVSNRLSDIQDSVLRISRVLSQQSVGEKFHQPLIAVARSIGGRAEETGRMRAALRQIAQLYEQTEMRMVDEAEHATVRYPQMPTGLVVLPRIVIPYLPAIGPEGMLDVDAGLIDWTPWDP